jgi:hypothetical protein
MALEAGGAVVMLTSISLHPDAQPVVGVSGLRGMLHRSEDLISPFADPRVWSRRSTASRTTCARAASSASLDSGEQELACRSARSAAPTTPRRYTPPASAQVGRQSAIERL